MRVTYIHHSSFMVELEHVVFLFDYFKGELPAFEQGKPLVVFASHRHGDHFSKVIFELAGRFENVSYVLSDDIWEKRVPEELKERTIFLGPGQEANPGGFTVQTFKSTDEGVAFLIKAEGKTIYHAGDLNNWVWAGEPEADNRRMSENYHRELEKLAGTHIDLAFIPLDPRQESDFFLGMDDFMRIVGADTVFPMHFWGDFEVTSRFKALPCAQNYKERIREIHEEGESFR